MQQLVDFIFFISSLYTKTLIIILTFSPVLMITFRVINQSINTFISG